MSAKHSKRDSKITSEPPAVDGLDLQRRRRAQNFLLVEHAFCTFADRMWLYAAGLLLIEAVSQVDSSVSPIQTSSLYGLILSAVKIFFSPAVGSAIERASRYKGAMIPLIIQNGSVAISAIMLFLILQSDGSKNVSPWVVFSVVTFFSVVAILASVGLQNVISRDWVVEICSNDDLTVTNAWLRSIDQATAIFSAAVAGITIAVDQSIGAITIGGFNIVSMIIQGICLHQIHNLVPELAVKPEAQKKAKKSLGENIKSKAKFFFDGWKLFVRQSVFIPGLVLAIMYINILGMSFPLQGYGREHCLSEATIAFIWIGCAMTGFLAPTSYPYLVKSLGLIGTGISGAVWQSGFAVLGIVALFIKGSPYEPFEDHENLIDIDETYNSTGNFWIRCPPGHIPPSSFLSIGIVMLSAVLQRWGLWIFDMIVTQLFQEEVETEERNRVAAGQFSCQSFFGFLLYSLSLVWGTADVFGTAVLITSGFIILGYALYLGWACSRVIVETETGEKVRISRIKRSRTMTSRSTVTASKAEITDL